MRFRLAFAAAAAAFGLVAGPAGAHDMEHMTMDSAGQPTSASLYNLESQWTTQDGLSVGLSALGGKPVVAGMGYTSCKDICPAIVADMMWIEKHLPQARPGVCASFSPRSTRRSTRPRNSRLTQTSTLSIRIAGRCFTATMTPCAILRPRSALLIARTGRAASTMPL